MMYVCVYFLIVVNGSYWFKNTQISAQFIKKKKQKTYAVIYSVLLVIKIPKNVKMKIRISHFLCIYWYVWCYFIWKLFSSIRPRRKKYKFEYIKFAMHVVNVWSQKWEKNISYESIYSCNSLHIFLFIFVLYFSLILSEAEDTFD